MPAGQAHRKEASLRDQARAPRKYELMTILHPDVSEESLPGELERISGFITAAGGELFETLQDSPWGRRRLAYPIRSGGRDVRDGYYTVWRFTLGPTRVNDLERELKLDTQLIRYIVLSWEPTPIDPKAVEAAEAAADTSLRLAAQEIRSDELTAEAEALEASGAELAIEPVEAIVEREQLEADAATALEMADTAAATETRAAEATAVDAGMDVPEGAVRGDGTGECPEDYPIKGNASSKLYHSPGSPSYKRTVPEYCFATVEAAEAAGFNPTKYEAAHEDGE